MRQGAPRHLGTSLNPSRALSEKLLHLACNEHQLRGDSARVSREQRRLQPLGGQIQRGEVGLLGWALPPKLYCRNLSGFRDDIVRRCLWMSKV